ncbi:hypothetical protein [Microbacterium sp.]|uniref:hypothetical protein n=1 Tax=Microbacterium sp. TaxID=51671 RepID=UPI00391C92E2
MANWYTADSPAAQQRVVDAWKDAPVSNVELLEMILEVACQQVLAYGNEAEGFTVPTRFVYAQLQQAKNLWNAGRVDSAGDVGPEGFSFTPRPLDKTVQNIIRPRSGVADVF